MLSELKELLGVWIAAVSAAIESVVIQIMPGRRVLLTEGEPGNFTARVISAGKDAILPAVSFHLSNGRAEPALNVQWEAALRGSQIDITMRFDQVLFRSVDFPRAAADFLDGMVRAQIDRLTPWAAADAVFGLTEPELSANDRIALTLAATSQQKIEPLLRFAAGVGASSVVGVVEMDDAAHTSKPIRVFQRSLGTGGGIDVPRLLRRGLLGASLAAAASLGAAAWLSSALDAEQQELTRLIGQRRAAIRINQPGGSAQTLLAKRKQASPSSVMVLEAISRALPDSTYVTELRVEGDRVQVVGLTQDAPSLIRLMEQSPQFTRATFFAPTTRSQNESGERFHIEAHITPYFGSGS